MSFFYPTTGELLWSDFERSDFLKCQDPNAGIIFAMSMVFKVLSTGLVLQNRFNLKFKLCSDFPTVRAPTLRNLVRQGFTWPPVRFGGMLHSKYVHRKDFCIITSRSGDFFWVFSPKKEPSTVFCKIVGRNIFLYSIPASESSQIFFCHWKYLDINWSKKYKKADCGKILILTFSRDVFDWELPLDSYILVTENYRYIFSFWLSRHLSTKSEYGTSF